MRVCRRCEEEKPLDQFRNRAEKPHLWEWTCKSCRSKQNAAQPNRRATAAKYRSSEKGQQSARRGVVARYGMTLQEYEKRVEIAGGVCEICGQPETKKTRGAIAALSVDHCHATGEVRGITCDDCNVALGRVHDSIPVLEKMIDYLKERGT